MFFKKFHLLAFKIWDSNHFKNLIEKGIALPIGRGKKWVQRIYYHYSNSLISHDLR